MFGDYAKSYWRIVMIILIDKLIKGKKQIDLL